MTWLQYRYVTYLCICPYARSNAPHQTAMSVKFYCPFLPSSTLSVFLPGGRVIYRFFFSFPLPANECRLRAPSILPHCRSLHTERRKRERKRGREKAQSTGAVVHSGGRVHPGDEMRLGGRAHVEDYKSEGEAPESSSGGRLFNRPPLQIPSEKMEAVQPALIDKNR